MINEQTTTRTSQPTIAKKNIFPAAFQSTIYNTVDDYVTLNRIRCFFLLQIFMHKSMQMQLQQRGGGAASVGSSSFSSSGGLEISKPHQCQQCLKSFSSNHQLVQHIRVHTGEKPYKCSYCERRFKQLSHVQQHTRLHTGKNWRPLFGYEAYNGIWAMIFFHCSARMLYGLGEGGIGLFKSREFEWLSRYLKSYLQMR